MSKQYNPIEKRKRRKRYIKRKKQAEKARRLAAETAKATRTSAKSGAPTSAALAPSVQTGPTQAESTGGAAEGQQSTIQS
jgi:hypothetical protein